MTAKGELDVKSKKILHEKPYSVPMVCLAFIIEPDYKVSLACDELFDEDKRDRITERECYFSTLLPNTDVHLI